MKTNKLNGFFGLSLDFSSFIFLKKFRFLKFLNQTDQFSVNQQNQTDFTNFYRYCNPCA
jgi:hypothetical protein